MKTEFKNNSLSDLMISLYNEFANFPGKEITGLSISINGFHDNGDVIEDLQFRDRINRGLQNLNLQSISTVANTIFPINLWNPDQPMDLLFSRYEKVLRHVHCCSKNRLGIYFERMINFKDGLNQLKRLITFYRSGNHRRSAFQVAIWDPCRDLANTRMRGFPCLQHVVFSCVEHKLSMIGFYASQYLFARAYGNFLGLCNLGKFMSHELGIPLCGMKCYIGVEQLDVSKNILSKILK